MKKNTRKRGVFHGFIGVIAFMAYALPFMFVMNARPCRSQAHESRRFLILLTANEITRLWCSWDPVFDGTIRLGIVDRSHYLAENGASVLRGFELVKPQVGLLRNPNKYVRTPLVFQAVVRRMQRDPQPAIWRRPVDFLVSASRNWF